MNMKPGLLLMVDLFPLIWKAENGGFMKKNFKKPWRPKCGSKKIAVEKKRVIDV